VTVATNKLWLAAEIVSSDDHAPDTVLKKQLYEELRLPRLWMIDPRYDNVEIYHASTYGMVLKSILAGGELLEEKLLPRVSDHYCRAVPEPASQGLMGFSWFLVIGFFIWPISCSQHHLSGYGRCQPGISVPRGRPVEQFPKRGHDMSAYWTNSILPNRTSQSSCRMNTFALFNVVAGILQLTVPSYALRLVRRFGAQRVGWFIVAAFAALGFLHLLQPGRALHFGLTSGLMSNAVFALTSGLLLLGMTHLETLLSERVQLQHEEQQLHAAFELKVAEKMTELRETNRELVEEIARREQREKALKESETQYRFLFADNPQPMWLFDLRSLRFLAVNQAALRHYGMDLEEFMSLTSQDLVPANAVPAFLQDVAKPCIRVESRGLWQHCRKDLSMIDVEVSAIDLKFAGCPARLVVAQDVTQRRRDEAESLRRQNAEIIGRLAGGFAHHFNNILTIIDGQANLLLRNPQDAKNGGATRANHRGGQSRRSSHPPTCCRCRSSISSARTGGS